MSERAIIFDLDDTLYDLCWPFQKAVEEFLGAHTNVPVDREVSGKDGIMDHIEEIFLASRKHSDVIFPDWTAGKVTDDDMYAYRNQHAFLDFGYEITREEALEIQSYYKVWQSKIQLSEKTKELLSGLKEAGVSMGIISNGGGINQMKKVDTLGLLNWIPEDMIIISGDTPYAKPDPRLFYYAEEKFGLADKEVWFVGDTFESDIVGAYNAGWRTIWFNRRHKEIPVIVSSNESTGEEKI